MDSNKINRWLTLGANLGVLVGIILILIELNQNATMMRGQTRNDVSVELINLMSQVVTNPQLASLIHKVNSGEVLTPEESVQFLHREIAMFRYFENVHYQYRQGLYDEAEYSTQREAWRAYKTPGRVEFWCGYRLMVSIDFRAEMDDLLAIDNC
jgi:hypothetical protein